MAPILVLATTIALAGGDMPKDPVLTTGARAAAFSNDAGSTAQYASTPKLAAPILPFMAFGFGGDLNLYVETTASDWSSHELIRMAGPDGEPRWAVLEGRADTGDLTLILEHDAPDLYMPELAIQRKRSEIDVIDSSTPEELRIEAKWTNLDGDPVEFVMVSAQPAKLSKHRNMPATRARGELIPAIDVPASASAFNVDLHVDGKPVRVRKVGGFFPMQFASQGSFGGFSAGAYTITQTDLVSWDGPAAAVLIGDTPADTAPVAAPEPAPPAAAPAATLPEGTTAAPTRTGAVLTRPADPVPDGLPVEADAVAPVEVPMAPIASFTTRSKMPSGNQVDQTWVVSSLANRVWATQASPDRVVRYEYRTNVDALELSAITVTPFGSALPATAIEFSPALPDLRRTFGGAHESRYVVDVNGMRSMATGRIVSSWTEQGLEVQILPDAPAWTVDRAMVSHIVFGDANTVTVTTEAKN